MIKPLVVVGIVLVIASVMCGFPPSSVAQTSEWKVVSFRKDVNPILQQNCVACHAPGGAGYAKSGFSVQSYQAVMKGTRYGAMVIPGSSVSSNLVWLLKHGAGASVNMPKMQIKVLNQNKYVVTPNQTQWLSAQDVWLISGWIDQGAKNN